MMDRSFKSLKIDTLYLVTQITKQQFQAIKEKDAYDFKRVGKYYDYIFNDNGLYAIKFNPIDAEGVQKKTDIMRSHWNIKIELQSRVLKHMPEHLKDLLSQFAWKIQQIELAFDFTTPFSQHFSYVGQEKVGYKFKKANGEIVDCGENYYVYAKSSSQQAVIYNKKKQMQDKKQIEIPDTYLLRYEITIKPVQKIQESIHMKNFEFLESYLDKFVFIPNMRKLVIKEDTYKVMQKVMRRRDKNFKKVSVRKREEIRKIADENRFDFVEAFRQEQADIFAWIDQLKATEVQLHKLSGIDQPIIIDQISDKAHKDKQIASFLIG